MDNWWIPVTIQSSDSTHFRRVCVYVAMFFYTIQNQGKLGQIAAKPSVPIVSGSGAPRMCHSSYLGVKLTKELFLMFSE